MKNSSFLLSLFCMLMALTTKAGVTVTTFNLENARVQSFVHGFTYGPGDASKVDNYNVSPPSRRDRPQAATVEWTTTSSLVSQYVVCSEKASFENGDTTEVTTLATTCDIYNLIPGKTYYYKVEGKKADGSKVVVKSDNFKTTGQVRMLNVTSGYNIRDLGGWPTASGYPIRYGLICRGAEMNKTYTMSSAGLEVMRKIGFQVDLDLRTADEADHITQSPMGSDVEYAFINLAHYYEDGVKNYASRFQPHMKLIFDKVKEGKMIYFHCQIGADRTGTIALLLEGLLGVSEYNLYKDYELTTFSGLGTTRHKDQMEPVIAYIKTLKGETLEDKFYTYFVDKIGMSPSDIMDFKCTMLGHEFIRSIDFGLDKLSMKSGESYQLSPVITPAEATDNKIIWTSSDTLVAKVDNNGRITALRGGVATITARASALAQTLTVVVDMGESVMPQSLNYEGEDYHLVSDNMISNGSFEYAHTFEGWTSGKRTMPDVEDFDVVDDEVEGVRYIRSKKDEPEDGAGSIRRLWPIEKDKTYVFGYRVKNTSGKAVAENENLKTLLSNDKSSVLHAVADDFVWDYDLSASGAYEQKTPVVAEDEPDDVPNQLFFKYPSYDGNWTDVYYVFTNTSGYAYCEIQFSHLSADGDNTCLDNFYLAEVASGKYKEGDVNGDYRVNGADVVSIYNYIQIGDESGISRDMADVNSDESVNGADAMGVYNLIVGSSAAGSVARSSVSASLKLSWTKLDTLSLWSDMDKGLATAATPCYIENILTAGASNFRSSAMGLVGNRKYYATYPYDRKSTSDLVKITYATSFNQPSNANTSHLSNNVFMYANAVADADGGMTNFQFHQLSSIIRLNISVPAEIKSTLIKSVMLSCEEEVFPVEVTYNPTDDNPTTTVLSKTKKIMLSLNNGKGFKPLASSLFAWFMIGETDLEGKTITVIISDGTKNYVGTFAGHSQGAGYGRQYDVSVAEAQVAEDMVDMGLGIYWATCNVGASSPEHFGDYYAWGETTPEYTAITMNELGDAAACKSVTWGATGGYAWANYFDTSTSGSSFKKYTTAGQVLDLEDDAAHVVLGDKWRMPTTEEVVSLHNNCSMTGALVNGVRGVRFTSKLTGNSIFIPGNGYFSGTTYSCDKSGYRLWSSTLSGTKNAYGWFNSYSSPGTGDMQYGRERYRGHGIRPVYDPNL